MSDFGTEAGGGSIVFFSVRKSIDDQGRPCAVLATKASKGDPGAKQVFQKDGSPAVGKDGEVWQKEYTFLEGKIIGLENTTRQMKGKDRHFLNVTVMGQSTKMVLSLERYDRYWVDFLCRLMNVNLTKPTKFVPYSISDPKKQGKTNAIMMLKQAGNNIEKVWNKANNYGNDADGKGGLPQGKQFTNPKTGELDWTFLERDTWLEDNVMKMVAAKLETMVQNGEIPAPRQSATHTEEPEGEEAPPVGATGAESDDEIPW